MLFVILKLSPFFMNVLNYFVSPLSFPALFFLPFSEHTPGNLLLTKILFPEFNSTHLARTCSINRTLYICDPKGQRVIVSEKQPSKKEERRVGWSCSRRRVITLWSEPSLWGIQTWTVTLAVWPWMSYILLVSHNCIIFKMNMVASTS